MLGRDSDKTQDAATSGAALIAKIRKSGFTVKLDDQDRPRIEPLNLLTPVQRDLLRQHKDAIRAALLAERPQPCLLTPFDEPSWETLAVWWLEWTPPEEPYDLGPGVRVIDPQKSYGYYSDLLKSGCRGQVQLALYDWIKRHARKFGGPQA